MLTRLVEKTISRYSMLSGGERVLVALSGGVDSIVLLDVLVALGESLDLKLSVCHLNHSLRGSESDSEEKFVEEHVRALGLELYCERLEPGALDGEGSLQQAARARRYDFFARAAKSASATKVALAHNSDDVAETVLMRVLKGSGAKGLGGIPPVRGLFIRPLIEASRKEIEEYVAKRKLSHTSDSSNLSTKYHRNKIRLELMPMLREEYNPKISETLTSIARSSARDNSFLESEANALFEAALVACEDNEVVLSRGELLGAHEALRARVFFRAVEVLKHDSRGIYSIHVEDFLSLIKSSSPGFSLDLPGGLFARREYERIVIGVEGCGRGRGRSGEESWSERPLVADGTTTIEEAGIELSATLLDSPPDSLGTGGERVAYFDMDSLCGELLVRPPLPGDRIRPLGMEGTKKLKDVFIDRKIPAAKRRLLPIIICNGEVVWAVGVKLGDQFKVTGTTRRILRVEIVEGAG